MTVSAQIGRSNVRCPPIKGKARWSTKWNHSETLETRIKVEKKTNNNRPWRGEWLRRNIVWGLTRKWCKVLGVVKTISAACFKRRDAREWREREEKLIVKSPRKYRKASKGRRDAEGERKLIQIGDYRWSMHRDYHSLERRAHRWYGPRRARRKAIWCYNWRGK